MCIFWGWTSSSYQVWNGQQHKFRKRGRWVAEDKLEEINSTLKIHYLIILTNHFRGTQNCRNFEKFEKQYLLFGLFCENEFIVFNLMLFACDLCFSISRRKKEKTEHFSPAQAKKFNKLFRINYFAFVFLTRFFYRLPVEFKLAISRQR